MPLLAPGDRFPAIEVEISGGRSLTLPDAFSGEYGVVLFNRGSWCPFCTGQLRAFQRALDDLHEAGAGVFALSTDDEESAAELVEKNGLTFPIGHSADAHRIAALTGAFVNNDPPYLQATGFVLDPQGRVVVSAYSSGAIGRIVPEDAIGLISHLTASAA